MSVLRLASVLVLSTVLSVVCATAAAVAQATPSTAPPGNSAVDQYRESLPPSSSDRRKLSNRDRDALERRGADGVALASVLERTGGVPRAAASSESDGASGGGSGSGPKAERSGSGSRDDAGRDSAATGGAKEASGHAPRDAADSRPIAPAAAASTVGPIPVWAMLAAAVALVGVGLVVRARSTS